MSAAQLKAFIIYLALAFVAVLFIATAAPGAPQRQVLVVAWMVLFPIGAWAVLRAGRK